MTRVGNQVVDVEGPERVGEITALGIDEIVEERKRAHDVALAPLLVPGRGPRLRDGLQQVPEEGHVQPPPREAGGPVVELGGGERVELFPGAHGRRVTSERASRRPCAPRTPPAHVGGARRMPPWAPTSSSSTAPVSTTSATSRWSSRGTA